MRNHGDLQVWSKAYSLSLELYRLSRSFPKEELYGLTSQLRRAAVSIGAIWPKDAEDVPIRRWRDLFGLP
jgi:hypothetical protein